MTDILAAIDAAVGCQHCGGPLGDSPSDDFCTDSCQHGWHAARAEQLVGYREPWYRPQDFPGVGSDSYTRLEFRLPPETSNLAADFLAMRRALAAATTPDQRAAVHLRAESLYARRQQRQREALETLRPVFEDVAVQINAVMDGWRQALAEAGRNMQAFFDAMRDSEAVRDEPPDDPMARALELRRNRNTGPARRGRAPRTIGRPSTSGRR